MVDWAKLVEERNVWVAYNFPTVDTVDDGHIPVQSVQGVIEELGELSHAHLKQAQSIRGSADEHIAAGKDAIGDMMVYLMGVMNYTEDLPLGGRRPFVARASADSALLHLAVVVGTLALRVDEHPKAKYFIADTVDRLVQSAQHYCEHRDWPFNDIVNTTWLGVKQRDWIKYPATGLPPETSALVSKHDVHCIRRRTWPGGQFICTCGLTDEQVVAARQDVVASLPLCPVCLREDRIAPGLYVSKSPGGTEKWSCGHTVGK